MSPRGRRRAGAAFDSSDRGRLPRECAHDGLVARRRLKREHMPHGQWERRGRPLRGAHKGAIRGDSLRRDSAPASHRPPAGGMGRLPYLSRSSPSFRAGSPICRHAQQTIGGADLAPDQVTCPEDVAFRVICANRVPDHATIASTPTGAGARTAHLTISSNSAEGDYGRSPPTTRPAKQTENCCRTSPSEYSTTWLGFV